MESSRARAKSRIHLPLMSLEQSSGMYLMMTLLRRYRKKPYKGDGSSYRAMAFRISTIPPVPRPSRPTSSREVYLRRNLELSSASDFASRGSGSAPVGMGGSLPAAQLRRSGIVSFFYARIIQAIQRHGNGKSIPESRVRERWFDGRAVSPREVWISGEPPGAPHGYGEPARRQHQSIASGTGARDAQAGAATDRSKATAAQSKRAMGQRRKRGKEGCSRQENLRCLSQARILSGILARGNPNRFRRCSTCDS